MGVGRHFNSNSPARNEHIEDIASHKPSVFISQVMPVVTGYPPFHLPCYVNISIIPQRDLEADRVICLIVLSAFTVETNIRQYLREKYRKSHPPSRHHFITFYLKAWKLAEA